MNSPFRVATAVASAVLLPFLTAASASAANAHQTNAKSSVSCPHDGYVTNWDVCTKLSNGTLIMNETNEGDYITTSYHKDQGSAISCKLGYLRNGNNHWSGTKTCKTSLDADASWTPSASCNPDVGLLFADGSTFQTPPTRKC